MAWKCPACQTINDWDDTARCVCGYVLHKNEVFESVPPTDGSVTLSRPLKICLWAVAFSYLSTLLSFGILPGSIFIEILGPPLIYIGFFPDMTAGGEAMWGFYIVYNMVWPLTLLFAYALSAIACHNSSTTIRWSCFAATVLITSLIWAKMCCHLPFVYI